MFGQELLGIGTDLQKWCSMSIYSGKKKKVQQEFNSSYYTITIIPFLESDTWFVDFYFSDITIQKKSEMELTISEEKYRKIVEGSSEVILKTDLLGDIVFGNKAFKSYFGLMGLDFLGMNFSEFLCDRDRDSFIHLFSTSPINNESSSSIVARVEFRDKTNCWLQINAHFNQESIVKSVTIIARDITAQILAEEKLSRSEEKYRSVIENMKLGLLEVDNDNQITKAYKHFCTLTGYSESELLGKRAIDVLLDKQEHKDGLNVQRKKRKNGDDSVYETTIVKKDGSNACVLISGAPLFNPNNEIVGSIGIHLDITERKKVETELINERRRAEESNKAKELFLANMSHEIRTPMNAIVGLSELLLKTALNDQQTKMTRAVETSSKNLLVIINDILDMSKVDSGKMTIERIGFSLPKLIKNIEDTNKIKAESKGILLHTSVCDDIPEVLIGDPFRLNQILINLVSNALKFTDRGTVNVLVYVKSKNADIVEIECTVQDSGKGIVSSELDNIFEAFDQEDNSITRNFGGTGLGLSITKKLVELIGGTVKVESTPGVGSKFTVKLPYKIGSDEDLPINEAKSINYKSLKGLKVLLAEDNEFNQTLIETLFLEHEIQLTIAENGVVALECLEENVFDVILMDIQMPEMDGVETTLRIRSSDKWKDLPIIALTANAFKDEQQQYLEAGMNDCLSKPFVADELYYNLLKYTDRLNDESFIDVPIEVLEDVKVDPLYSLDRLSLMAGGNDSFVKKMVLSFTEHTPKVLTDLEGAVEEGNWVLVSSLAHRLKSGLNLLGINSVAEEVLDLEKNQHNYVPQELIEKSRRVLRNSRKAVLQLEQL